jgi:hypothetical protein
MPTYNQAQIDLNATSPRLSIINDPLNATTSSVVVTGDRQFKFTGGNTTPTVSNIILTATVSGAVATVVPNYTWQYYNTTNNDWANLLRLWVIPTQAQLLLVLLPLSIL